MGEQSVKILGLTLGLFQIIFITVVIPRDAGRKRRGKDGLAAPEEECVEEENILGPNKSDGRMKVRGSKQY